MTHVEIADGTAGHDDRGIWISSGLFARYAESHLDRWRQLIGYRVQHNDFRWGIGIVEAVSWGSPCEHVDAYVQVRIRYGAGWTASVHSASWDQHHQRVMVPVHIEGVIRQCLDPSLSDDEQAECLARHARELRKQSDRASLDRARKRKQRDSYGQERGSRAAR